MEGDPLLRRSVGIVIAGLLPWAWFVLRDWLGVVTDVIAIVLPLAVLVTAVVSLVVAGLLVAPGPRAMMRRRWGRVAVAFAVSTLLVGIVATFGPWVPHGTGTVDKSRAVRIAAANIGSGELDGADNLLALKADVLVVSEIGPPLTERLSESYPEHVAVWKGPAIGVFSRWPLTVLESPDADLPGFVVRVHAPSGEFDLIAVHVPRPWWKSSGPTDTSSTDKGTPYETTVAGHHRLIEQIAARAARDDRPVVVAGDLNTTDRGRDYRVLTEHLNDAMLDNWGRPSQIAKWSPLLIRIDHLFVKPGWCSDDNDWYPIPASDHHGLVSTIGPCA
ncbi:endonuclease/exonuclease/phosphatase (EEP) superfamily protein YafD [Kribbella sp. VKM Ac-2569]|uniref:endonuclease/exonuclease/phosphatase family protein n=1 Tax=Kribbella sp. VKM Ac-2569 TaxID=2512220 RepID=UPI00102B06D7|nr:endonuclease/exonuclease/phosphatase family protein [Kribbella sp. VKM Ac-2569]RZT17156.1 endonuclease/exonuclease/phosphatase (EEP) superfamily protein YafD [Kribbella sp. VKM Ac-2569]